MTKFKIQPKVFIPSTQLQAKMDSWKNSDQDDSDLQNSYHAAWGEGALEYFHSVTGSELPTKDDPGNALSDLLGDLMHYARAHDIDFDEELDRGRRHYVAEVWEAKNQAGEVGK